MANHILWQLVSGFNPLGEYASGLNENQRQQNILEQLIGQREDRQFNRERDLRDFQFRTQESDRNQRNTDRSFEETRSDTAFNQRMQNANLGLNQQNQQFNQMNQNREFDLKKRIANEAQVIPYDPEKPLIRIDRQGASTPIVPPGLQINPTNPYAPPGKLTDEQAKAAGFANRMAASNDIIGKFENINSGVLGNLEGVVSNAAPALANPALSANRQQFIQAQRDFINAILRRESGAVISDQEFANARQQYFPQPGDGADVIEQKRQNRIEATKGIMGAAGKNYQPPKSFQQNAPQQQAPIFAVNPQTGQRIQFQNGRWVPVQ